jgi:hypothetical protein
MLRQGTVVAVIGALSLATPAGGTTGARSTASELYNEARAAVLEQHPPCQVTFAPTGIIRSHASPQAGLLDLVSALRHPGTAADRAAARSSTGFPMDSREYIDYARLVRAADGRRFLLMPLRSPLHPDVEPGWCTKLIDSRFGKLLRGRPAKVRRAGAAIVREQAVNDRSMIEASRYDGAWLGSFPPPASSTTSGLPYPTLRRMGVFLQGNYSLTAAKKPRVRELDGLVPDGVARISVWRPRVLRWRGAISRSKVVFRRSYAVRDNVVDGSFPHAAPPIFLIRVTWWAANGRMLRRYITLVSF